MAETLEDMVNPALIVRFKDDPGMGPKGKLWDEWPTAEYERKTILGDMLFCLLYTAEYRGVSKENIIAKLKRALQCWETKKD